MQKVPHFNSRTQAPGQGTRVYSDLAPPGGVWLCLEDPFYPFSLLPPYSGQAEWWGRTTWLLIPTGEHAVLVYMPFWSIRDQILLLP